MRRPIRIIALDLDGTLLNSNKELTAGNRAALERAAEAGIQIVPTTGRFYGGMPQVIRELPFVRYVITVNGAAVADLRTGEVIYRAELPLPSPWRSWPFWIPCRCSTTATWTTTPL